MAPFLEELMFRAIPLELSKIINIPKLTLLIIIAASLWFGMGHAYGKWNVPIQGVGGVVLCYVYIKNGYSYLSIVAMHFLINLTYFLK